MPAHISPQHGTGAVVGAHARPPHLDQPRPQRIERGEVELGLRCTARPRRPPRPGWEHPVAADHLVGDLVQHQQVVAVLVEAVGVEAVRDAVDGRLETGLGGEHLVPEALGRHPVLPVRGQQQAVPGSGRRGGGAGKGGMRTCVVVMPPGLTEPRRRHPGIASVGCQVPLRSFTASVSCGATLNRSPTTPKSAISKIGASASLFTATIVFEVCMPARCWIAPEMPRAT